MWREQAAVLIGAKCTLHSGVTFIGEFYTPPNTPYFRDASVSPLAGRQPYTYFGAGKNRLRDLPGWKEWNVSGSVVANLNDHSLVGVVDLSRWFGNHFTSYVHLEVPSGSKNLRLRRSTLQHGHLRRSAVPPMNPTRNPSIDDAGRQSNKTVRAFKAFCSEIWIVPAIAVVIAILILVIGHALSQIGAKFLSSFIYAMLIGFPTALSLNWIGFRYTERFPRLIFLIFIAVLIAIATCGSLLGASVLQVTGIIPPDFYLREVQSSLPICLGHHLVVGLSITSYETLRHRLQDATLELRTRQVEQERANKLLVEARLSSLESRIHPHFLFNTLNSIASLIPSDPKRAEDTVGKLASLLRFSISANQSSLVPLSQELKIVRDYLEIESTRFGQRLRYDISVPDTLGPLQIPPLALQTFVENSIKHVAAQRNQPSSIRIDGTQRTATSNSASPMTARDSRSPTSPQITASATSSAVSSFCLENPRNST